MESNESIRDGTGRKRKSLEGGHGIGMGQGGECGPDHQSGVETAYTLKKRIYCQSKRGGEESGAAEVSQENELDRPQGENSAET